MKTLLALMIIALPASLAAQDTDSPVRRVIDTQLGTGMTQPPGPGVPGSEAARLLGRGGGTPAAAPAAEAAAPAAGSVFGPGQTGTPGR